MIICEVCGAKATHYTLDGADSKFICQRWPHCHAWRIWLKRIGEWWTTWKAR